jgi:arylsulfatase A-like enzyme
MHPTDPHYVEDKYREPYGKLDHSVASFFGEIANIDENMGQLDAMLRSNGLYDDTILLFMTDNGGTAGTALYNAGMRGKKGSLYDGGHRVPCFLRWPAGDFCPPGDYPELTQIQDLLPTLIDLCGLTDSQADFDGTSLARLLTSVQRLR